MYYLDTDPMNTRYCPRCAARNQYTVAKPVVCEKCGCDMNAAFASAAIVVPTTPTQPSNPLVAAATQRSLRSSLVKRRPVIEAAEEGPDIDDDDEDDSYDETEVRMLVQEWSQEIDASMFFSEIKGGPIKLGDLPNVREAAEKMAEGSTGKRGKKGRK